MTKDFSFPRTDERLKKNKKREPYTEPRAVHEQLLLPTVAYIATSNTELGQREEAP